MNLWSVNKKYNNLNLLDNFLSVLFILLIRSKNTDLNNKGVSSVVERYVDIVEAISSILITPTKFLLNLNQIVLSI